MDIDDILPMLKRFLKPEQRQIVELILAILPKEQREAIIKALMGAIPAYHIAQNVTFAGRKYTYAIFIEAIKPAK